MMNYLKLAQVCKINMGQSPESSTYNNEGDGLPFFQGNADFGEICPVARIWCNRPTKIAQEGDILISVRAPIGSINYATEMCCIGRGLAAITPDTKKVFSDFIYWLLKAKNAELNSKGTGSTFKAIGKKVLEEFLVPDISLEKQKKYTEVIKNTLEIIHMRQMQKRTLDNLIKARFVEMFGDFKTNPMGWPIVSFEEIAIIDGNMTTDYERYADYPHIGIDSIEKDSGLLKGYRTVAEDGVISGKFIFTPAHIIYSKIRPNLNKVALPDFDGLCSADAYPILPVAGKCNRVFLAYDMRSTFFLDYILQFCNRTNLPKVNRKEVAGFRTPLPPIELQEQFAAFVTQVDKSKVVEV